MAIALVTNTAAHSPDGNAVTTSPGVDTSSATLLVAVVSLDKSSAPTLLDSKSNTWVAAVSDSANQPGSYLYYVKNPTVGAGHTFTAGGPSFFACVSVLAFSGTDTTVNVDQTNHFSQLSGSSVQPGSVTPTTDNQVVVTGLGTEGSNTPTINGGFTITDTAQLVGGQHYGTGCAYLIQTTATAANPTWTGFETEVATIATFKAAAGGDTLFAQACL